ncbi:hypothetical protein Tco_0094469, partial [Tanacetum coccineum]
FKHANEDNESDVHEVHDETASFMSSELPKDAMKNSNKSGSGAGNMSLYEHWKEKMKDDPCYDDD